MNFVNFLKSKDEIAPTGFSQLHIRNNLGQKTVVGGCLSLFVSLYVVFIAYTKGRQMLQFDSPDISSIEETMKYNVVGKIKMVSMAKPLFEILEGGDNTVDLEAVDYKKYINIRLVNVVKNIGEDGEVERTDKYYEIERCEKQDFEKNAYLRQYWKSYNSRA